jgi:hypothetical protein
MQKALIAMMLVAMHAAVHAEPAELLVYKVWEQGIEPYINRIMVTPDYIRLDEGTNDDSYTLFDRSQEIIYNVSPEDRSVLVINPTEPLPEPSDSLILAEQVKPDAEAPLVAGRQPLMVRLLANGETCGELVVIDGVMEEAVDAMIDLKQTLARAQASTLAATPLDMQTPCDLAGSVYAPDRVLRFGLPLQERSSGRSQSLVDFASDHEVDSALFELPADFRRQSMFSGGAI